MNEPESGVNLGPVYDGDTVGPTYDAGPLVPPMIDEMGLPVAENQGPPKRPEPHDLDIDEPRIIDRKKDQ